MFSEFSAHSQEQGWRDISPIQRDISPIQREQVLTLQDLETSVPYPNKHKVTDQLLQMRRRVSNLQQFLQDSVNTSVQNQSIKYTPSNPQISVNSFHEPQNSLVETSQFGIHLSEYQTTQVDQKKYSKNNSILSFQGKQQKENQQQNRKIKSHQEAHTPLFQSVKKYAILKTNKKQKLQNSCHELDETKVYYRVSQLEGQVMIMENNRSVIKNQIDFYQSQNKKMNNKVIQLKTKIKDIKNLKTNQNQSNNILKDCLDQSSFIRKNQNYLIKRLNDEKIHRYQ